jgi:hypothetical protein
MVWVGLTNGLTGGLLDFVLPSSLPGIVGHAVILAYLLINLA